MSDPRRPAAETLPTVFEKGPRATPSHHVVGDLQVGAQVGNYRIVRLLGAGGMGSVYEAVHTEIGKTVALKLLSRDLAADPRARARFLREALAASRLVHPHVVNVTDVGAEGDIPFMVMEMLRGEDLAACINRQPRGLPIEEAIDILLAVSAGVFAAHEAGVVHRDLKPRNIFLARNTVKTEVEPKVLDFGISKLDGGAAGLPVHSLTETGALLGTVPYLSPEHVKGGATDARSDQYALGVVLFECITGRYPHEGHTPYAVLQNIAEGRCFAPSAFRADVPAGLERHIARAMSTDPGARFRSVHDFGRALLPFASGHGQLVWGEYFGRGDREAQQPTATSTAPVAIPAANPARAQEPHSTLRSARPRLRRPAATARWIIALGAIGAAGAAIALGAFDAQTWQRAREILDARAAPIADRPVAAARAPAAAPAPVAVPAPVAEPPAVARTPAPAPTPPVATAPPVPPAVAVATPPQATGRKKPAGPRTVSIELTSDPSGATVWLDKEIQPRGQTPLTLALPAAERPHALTFRLRGHQPRVLPLVPSENRALDVALAKAPASRLRARASRPRRAGGNNPAPAEGPSDDGQDSTQEWSEKLVD